MTQKTILIIGAGISGLAAGCYGQMNGYQTEIFELHTQPGGLCTSWNRKGYTFDGCIQFLVGSGPGRSIRRVWDELGALQQRPLVNLSEHARYEAADGRILVLYSDPDRLERHLLELSPADAAPIKELADGVRLFARFNPPLPIPPEAARPLDLLKMLPSMLPFLGPLKKYGQVSMLEFAARFHDPFLRQAFTGLYDGFDMPLLLLLMTLGSLCSHNAGCPLGGSLKFAQDIEQRYLALGGRIHYRARVEKILVETGRAVGLRLADPAASLGPAAERRGDGIISAADGHSTLFDLLGEEYLTPEIRTRYASLVTYRPRVIVSLGVRRDLSNEPVSLCLALERPVTIAGEERRQLAVRHFSYDPSLTAPGCSVIEVTLVTDHAYWQALCQGGERGERYEAEKAAAAQAVIAQLERRFPGLAAQVEVVDVATPLTFERYTANWNGIPQGWMVNRQTVGMITGGKGMSKSLPGLENFYMTGQWVEPGGGIPTAALSARALLQIICHKDKRPFVTTV